MLRRLRRRPAQTGRGRPVMGHRLQKRSQFRFIQFAVPIGIKPRNDFLSCRRWAARPWRPGRKLDLSVQDIFVQRCSFALIELAVMVDVVFVEDFLGQRRRSAGTMWWPWRWQRQFPLGDILFQRGELELIELPVFVDVVFIE